MGNGLLYDGFFSFAVARQVEVINLFLVQAEFVGPFCQSFHHAF
jgi:hypothetical protein